MQRYFVCRHWIKWKGKIYKKGELLPENFTHHDRARNIYSSRIGTCEVEVEDPAPQGQEGSPEPPAPAAPLSGQPNPAPPAEGAEKGTAPAAKAPFVFKPTTGTPK